MHMMHMDDFVSQIRRELKENFKRERKQESLQVLEKIYSNRNSLYSNR